MNNDFDILEIILRKDLKLPLTEAEEKWLNDIDDETKKTFYELVNNSACLEEIKEVIEHIIKISSRLPEEEQAYIKVKCQNRIQKLEHPSLSRKSFNVISK